MGDGGMGVGLEEEEEGEEKPLTVRAPPPSRGCCASSMSPAVQNRVQFTLDFALPPIAWAPR